MVHDLLYLPVSYSAVVSSDLLPKVIFQPAATDYGPYDYTRSGNPTRDVLQRLVHQYGAFPYYCSVEKFIMVLMKFIPCSALWLSLRRQIKHSASPVGWQH